MSSRLRSVQEAARPKMFGRALVSGPSGAGKTWTSLSIATYLVAFEKHLLAGGTVDEAVDLSTVEPKDILVIDTEKESSLTYADVFKFSHLPWRPPYSPDELRETLEALDAEPPIVTIIDSFSKFWQGQGGTLDIAGGAIGGWKAARPLQERMVEQILSTGCHMILGVRSKMDYLIEGGKGNQTVTKLGLSPIQDDTLVYEMNVAIDIDMNHQITVTKSRTPAVPVGRMFPAGLERKLAEDYAEWLAGGIPPANRDDIARVVDRFAQIVDRDEMIRVKSQFVERFGMPHSMTAAQVPEADSWLDEELAKLDVDEPAKDTPAEAEVVKATLDEMVDEIAQAHQDDPDDPGPTEP